MESEEFDRKFTAHLNPQQKAAVHAVEGPVLLLAVPGSGKTTVLVTRLGYMLYCCGIAPARILTMTYTVAATNEMRQRYARQFGPEYAGQLEFLTINSLANRIIRYYIQEKGREGFQLISEGERAALIGNLLWEATGNYPSPTDIRQMQTAASYVKNQMLEPEELQELGIDRFPELYTQYCDTLRQQRQMDFDDQLIFAKRILEKHPDVLEYFRACYPYLCVDESQDTSKIQHAIIRLLAKKSGNLFMVGDEDQSIYGFRAAYPQALLQFDRVYPGAQVLLMEDNYRSTPEILDAANRFVQKNLYRRPKTMRPTRSSGEAVEIIYTCDRQTQYAYLEEIIKSAQKPIAVLYRNNDAALPLVDRMDALDIPFTCKQMDDGFFTHRVVTDITDIVHYAANPDDPSLFMRTYYKLGCGISRQSAQDACRQSRETGKPILWQLLRQGDLSGFTRQSVTELTGILPMLAGDSAETGLERIWNRLGYSKYVEDNGLDGNKYTVLCLLARRQPHLSDLLRRLEQLRAKLAAPQSEAEARLVLATIHSSKGLEYDTVYLLDMVDGILPSKPEGWQNEEEIRIYQEERRLFYVAMTRAKNKLSLFACNGCYSAFLAELLGTLPRPAVALEDVFASLHGNLCGRQYCHRKNGAGTITASSGTHCLVTYESGRVQLLSLAQMLEMREVKYQKGSDMPQQPEPQKQLAAAAADPETIKRPAALGETLIHKKFGPGTVVSVRDPYVTIRFSPSHGTKMFQLEDALLKGLLRFEEKPKAV